ncbi:MAG TPA: protein kinase [Herpetosiphonaceae bacterium]|nr:protein kinase [Herpetosiphonaceae bacterium]
MASLFQPRKRARELQLAHALRNVPLFKEVPPQDLVAIWRRLREVQAPAGSILCRRGDAGDRCYIVQSGTIEVRLGLGPASVLIRLIGPGDVVGEMALITGQPRSADVVVTDDVILWELDRAAFDAILGTSVPLLRALNRALCDLVVLMTHMVEQGPLGGPSGVAGMRIGPYRVMAQLGSGGMGVVYHAVHMTSGAAVALKVLPVAMGAAHEFHERLQRETAALWQLDHPNVIRVVDSGTVEERLGSGCYLALEWLPDALDRVRWTQYPEPLDPREALRLAHGVVGGLEAIHAAGLVHRDVKPSNILLREDGTPVLIDFGLVAATAPGREERRLTASNVIVGTADYMAPEQVAGLPIDGRTDLYALGVTLYELLAGHVPFAGRDPLATLQAHVEEPPPPLPSSVPAAARSIVERAIAKRPAERFPSATAMAAAIEEALAELGVAPHAAQT